MLKTPRKAGNVHHDLKLFDSFLNLCILRRNHLLSQQYARCILENVCPEFSELSTKNMCIY